MNLRVLVVDDTIMYRKVVGDILAEIPGIEVDDAIVVVENIVRHMRLPASRDRSLVDVAVEAVIEVGNPTILATWAVIAAISLVVAGIMIMNVMLVAISNRKAEIGLLKALGASKGQIMKLFLTESTILSSIGAAIGLMLALLGIQLAAFLFPQFPLYIAPWSPAIALGVALITGIIFGVFPARRAASLEPALSLARR